MYLDYTEAKSIQTDNRNFLIYKVSKYGFIQVCSFLEEYSILSRLSKDDDNLRDTLYVCAPVIRSLKKYNGLTKMRNLMLAHVNRDKLGNFKPWWNELNGLRKPSTEKDINELYESLAFVIDMLSVRHKKEWDEAIPYLEKSVKDYMTKDAKVQFDKIEKEKSMREINAEVLKRMKEKNISPLPRKK